MSWVSSGSISTRPSFLPLINFNFLDWWLCWMFDYSFTFVSLSKSDVGILFFLQKKILGSPFLFLLYYFSKKKSNKEQKPKRRVAKPAYLRDYIWGGGIGTIGILLEPFMHVGDNANKLDPEYSKRVAILLIELV